MKTLNQILNKHNSSLKKIDENIRKITKSNYPVINHSISDLISGGGKRLRPLMVILSGCFGDYNSKILEMAAGIEILHMATLVHDDIIDDAEKRRGNNTAQNKFGNNTAVFIGDFLLSKAFKIFVKHSQKKPMYRLSNIVNTICEGEINQFQNKFNTEISITQYFKRIRKKTALLFGFSTYLGAYESGLRNQELYNLYNVGLNFGMAFQIQDDILDFQGQEKIMGKEIGQDIDSGVYTLPLVIALKNDNNNYIHNLLLKDNLKKEEINYIINRVNEIGIKPSKNIMRKFLKKADHHLDKLNNIQAKIDLKEIINCQYSRNF